MEELEAGVGETVFKTSEVFVLRCFIYLLLGIDEKFQLITICGLKLFS